MEIDFKPQNVLEQAKKLVKEFVEEMLSGDMDNFRTFDLKQLRTNDKYGCPGRNFDCDDTELMRAVYVILWSDVLPGLQMDNFGYRKQYRGDTLNTFHTMFGRPIPERPGFFAGVEKYAPTEELREKVRFFGSKYHTVGNYIVLPNYFAGKTSLNCYRGTNDWHDFFDRFLSELYKVQTGADSGDEILKELVQVNSFCFSRFTGEKGMEIWIEKLFLTEYCSKSNGRPCEIFAMNYHWKNINARERYLEDALHYIDTSCRIISCRTEKMLARLKEVLQI